MPAEFRLRWAGVSNAETNGLSKFAHDWSAADDSHHTGVDEAQMIQIMIARRWAGGNTV